MKVFTPGSIFRVDSSQAFSNYTRLFIASFVERCQNVKTLCVSQLEFDLSSYEENSYLALHHALLFESEVLWSVSHGGELCLGVVSVK